MKIEKGYTYPQFIKIIDSKVQIAKNNSEDYSCAWGIDKIVNFDLLCDKPLKKEMFVNEIEKPTINKGFLQSLEKGYELMEEWKSAEKKVIFKGWKLEPNHNIVALGELEVWFGDIECPLTMTSLGLIPTQTIGELFYFTNGELETKNLEI